MPSVCKESNITELKNELLLPHGLYLMFTYLSKRIFMKVSLRSQKLVQTLLISAAISACINACSFKPYAISVNDQLVYSPSGVIVEEVFADAGLQACVNNFLNNNPEANLNTITQLSCTDTGITSLIGLSNLPELSMLDVSNNNITDLSPIIYLEKLRLLRIANNSIRNIELLNTLNLLNFIDLSGNEELSCRQLDQLENRLGSSLRRPLRCN